MKWVARFKDKVGLQHAQSPSFPGHEPFNHVDLGSPGKPRNDQDSELQLKRLWEEFRCSNSEKEKEAALEMAIDVFCRLARRTENPVHLIQTLVDARVFTFVVAKALVTEIDKLKKVSMNQGQGVKHIFQFFMEPSNAEINGGGNMLYALESLVSPPLDLQPLLDAGLLSSLVWVLHTIFGQPGPESSPSIDEDGRSFLTAESQSISKFLGEGSIIHIMKALAQHPGATQSITEDDCFKLLFYSVANYNNSFLPKSETLKLMVSLSQLHRQALQILGLLLNNDNGGSAQYIRKHQLVKVLLKVIRDFDSTHQDAEYAVGVADLLLQCVELSCRPESLVRLREDLHNAHGYSFLVQFALKVVDIPPISSPLLTDPVSENLSPVLTRLLDILVNLAQVGTSGTQMAAKGKTSPVGIGSFLFHDVGMDTNNHERQIDGKVKDMEAVQVLQDIFLKAPNLKVQLEVLDRLLRIFASHIENYSLCQELRTLPLFILNMPTFPEVLQERLLKILEYAAIVVNCVPEQELLSLCCLLQQPLPGSTRKSILLLFNKLLSFDKQYKKVLREVGALEVLIDDLKKLNSCKPHKSSLAERIGGTSGKALSREISLRALSFTNVDAGHSSPKTQLFEEETTLGIAWDFLITMLKGTEGNQAAFRKMNGVNVILPLLISSSHRPAVLRLLTCLITEDVNQTHQEELCNLIDIVKSGAIVNSISQQAKVDAETKKDLMWTIYRILLGSNACKDVFGGSTGFSLLFTVLHSFQTDPEFSSDDAKANRPVALASYMQVFEALMNVTKAAVSGHPANRAKLDKIISSQTFKELLCESGLLNMDYEKQVTDLLLSLALEKQGAGGMLVLSSEENGPNVASGVHHNLEETVGVLVKSTEVEQQDAELPEVVLNVGAIKVVISCIEIFSPSLQVRVLEVIKRLSQCCAYNRDCMASIGCVSMLLDFANSVDSNTRQHELTLNIVEILGSYRLSSTELRTLARRLWYSRDPMTKQGGQRFLESMRRLIQYEAASSESSYNVPFTEFSMNRSGYACMNISLGDRTWPPAGGYSFACWMKYYTSRKKCREVDGVLARKATLPRNKVGTFRKDSAKVRIFSVGSTEEKSHMYVELYVEDSGIVTLSTGNSNVLSFKGVHLEEGIWHHLVLVHNKPNAIAGLFQSSSALLYVNGKLRQTGKLGYSTFYSGKSLQATIGTPSSELEMLPMCWSIGSCYLFEEVISTPSVFLMYALGRGYRGLFQDVDLLRFIPYEACGGGNLATFEGLELELTVGASNKVDSSKVANKVEGSGVVWSLERLGTFVGQLAAKKLIFCFDGTFGDANNHGPVTLVNLVDPLSAAASPLGGLPLMSRLYGDINVCSPCSLGENIRKIGGVPVVLALVKVADNKEMLHVALSLLMSILRCNPHNIRDMSAARGYHLLALFLRPRMCFFDLQDLEILFHLVACEASSVNSHMNMDASGSSLMTCPGESSFDSSPSSRVIGDESSPFGSQTDPNDCFQVDLMSQVSDIENVEVSKESSSSLVITNIEMMEHVLMDWTLWATAPITIQIALLGFIERLVSMHKYRTHNLTLLRHINIVHHLLVTLQRGDLEIPVLEKLVVLLGILLEDGFLSSELKSVVDFVIMTLDPPEALKTSAIPRESLGLNVIVRNMLLEMLIDLQVTISSEETLDSWHKTVSSRLITFLLDEGVHPTTMRWVMTLLGVCLSSSNAFALKFRNSGGFQSLVQVLPSFFDCPEVYYILFCLMFSKPVYPRQPEVRMMDFLALMPDNGSAAEIVFTDFLEVMVAMFRAAFDRLYLQKQSNERMLEQMQGTFAGEDSYGEVADGAEQLQGEALLHKTYAARLLGGEAAAPSVVTSLIRYMVDLAKMCAAFSSELRRQDLLENCTDLYFSCIRSANGLQVWQPKGDVGKHNVNDTDHDTLSESESRNVPQDTESIGSRFLPPGSPISETSGFSSCIKPSQTMSDTPFDSTSHSETNFATSSFATPSTSLSGLNSGVYYRMSFSGEDNHEFGLQDVKANFLLKLESVGSGGGPCSSGSVAVLDLIAEVLADALCQQLKAVSLIEAVLEAVPSCVSSETVLAFQGLCLGRVINCFERRLLRDDEEVHKRLDKSKWSSNLEAFSTLIVDSVYMGAFTEPGSVLKVLEFLVSMLQLANKDHKVEEATLTAKSLLLPLTRGANSKQVEAYVQTLLKNMNRMIMYCFTPAFLCKIGEDEFISSGQITAQSQRIDDGDGTAVDMCTLLQVVIANRQLILCPINVDADLVCCLCVNSINLLWDSRQSVRMLASEVMKSLLINRKAVLEELLIVKPNQGEAIDVLHGGFDMLLSSDFVRFCEWLEVCKESVVKVLDQCASIMWMKYITNAAKFPGLRVKQGDGRRKRELSKRYRETSKFVDRHWEHMSERRYALDDVRDSMTTELRVLRQDKYGWILHAESEWEVHLQHLVHERGIIPMHISPSEEQLQWALCPTEGPFRMRKRFVRCKVKIDVTVITSYGFTSDIGAVDLNNPDEVSFFHQFPLTDDKKTSTTNDWSEDVDGGGEELIVRDEDSTSSVTNPTFTSDNCPPREPSRSVSVFSGHTSIPGDFAESQRSFSKSSVHRNGDIKHFDGKSQKDARDDGEYLIRPFLEPGEKIRHRYNCERVMGMEKKDGLFLIGETCLYVIENFYTDAAGCIKEKVGESDLSIIDQAIGVKPNSVDEDMKQANDGSWKQGTSDLGARAWAESGSAWGREQVQNSTHVAHPWRRWKLNSVHELLKRRYQLRPVAIELFCIDGCNDLLIFHKNERDEVFKNLVAMNLPRNNMLDATISGASKQDSNEGSRLFKLMAKSFSKRWQNGEISNFQYLMHLNTLAGRGYNDLTQHPVFPWVLADYESENLNLDDPNTFRQLDKPMGALSPEREEEFKRRYDSWDDPDIPKFHYGSHYSSAGIVLFYLIRIPPFSIENQKLQGGQFDHADRLFNSISETWQSASRGNTADVKELIPEFFYLPEMFENRFNLEFGVKQSGEKVNDVILPPWAKGSAREFVKKHREALESQYVSENLHHWIDLIFGYRQQGKAAVEATNVFFHLTYEDAVDIDSIEDPAMKASLLAQINHFGQTPRQLFQKPHPKRRVHQKVPTTHVLRWHNLLTPQEIRTYSFAIHQINFFHEKLLVAGLNSLLKPRSYSKYVAWGFPDRSLRFLTYDQDKLLSTHEGLHGSSQINCTGFSRDGRILVTGGEDGVVAVWRLRKQGVKKQRHLELQKALCAHTHKVTCLSVCQPYGILVSGSEDCSVILWDLNSLEYVLQLPLLPAAVSAVHANELTGNIVTAAGTTLAVWSINGDCLARVNTSQLPSDTIVSVTSSSFSDWMETNWFITGHQSGSVKVWRMDHNTTLNTSKICKRSQSGTYRFDYTRQDSRAGLFVTEPKKEQDKGDNVPMPEYELVLLKVLKWHKDSITCVYLTSDLKQLLSGDSKGHLISWILPQEIDEK